MIELSDYRDMLTLKGQYLGHIRKEQADMVENATFTGDIAFRRVFILDPQRGWHYEDAKFSKHAAVSLSKDSVDSYLQFRPKVHYPIGTYVFIPQEPSYELEINYDDPLCAEAKNLWLIIERTDARQFTRYLVIKCDWIYKWITEFGGTRRVAWCWGCAQAANSYTSGVWNDYYLTGLDNLSSAYLPNTFYTYGEDGIKAFHLQDTRSVKIQLRFMITTNRIDPKCFMVTKIGEMNPKGILKLSIKADDYDSMRDNVDLMVCDYYTASGDTQVVLDGNSKTPQHTSVITYQELDADGYLAGADMVSQVNIATAYYFKATTDDGTAPNFVWRIKVDGCADGDALQKLVYLTRVAGDTTMLKIAKSNKLNGKTIILSASDANGDYTSSIGLEVV